jgi:hypothetical protein
MMDRFPFKDYPDAPLSHEIGLVLKNSVYFDISSFVYLAESQLQNNASFQHFSFLY